jgi:8-hydroxy-5-deazaflavin:NADPH oxidoreductase
VITSSRMKIGIYGSGMIGGTLARLWLAAGHEVRFGARDTERTARKVPSLDVRATVGTLEETARWADALLLAIPLHATVAVGAAIAAAAAGKLVLDAGNAIPSRDGAAAAEAAQLGSAVWVARQLPGAHVVKAFNTVYFKTIASEAHRPGERVAVPLVGDDESALALAERLVSDAGLEPVRVGGLAASRSIDYGSPVWNTGMTAAAVRRTLGL